MAQYALIKDNLITNLYDSIPVSFGNEVSGFHLLTDEEREKYGFYKVEQPDLSLYNPELHKIDLEEHIIVDGRPVHIVQFSEIYTEEELLQKKKDDFWRTVRDHRNYLLSKSDWTMMSDLVSVKGESWVNTWSSYRQQLRNLTDNQNLFEENNGAFNTSMFPSEPNL